MDLSVENTITTPTMTPPPASPPRPGAFMGVALLSALVASAMAFYLFWQNQMLHLKLVALQASPSPTASAIALASADPTADWQTYTNTKQGVAFRYPDQWELTETPGSDVNGQIVNQNVMLSNGPASISMNFNMDGIGGAGRDYEGTALLLDGNNVYKYTMDRDNGTVLVGITDTLKTSLGLFEVNDKTYSISLVYPANEKDNTYESDFDQILSTFTFTPTVE